MPELPHKEDICVCCKQVCCLLNGLAFFGIWGVAIAIGHRHIPHIHLLLAVGEKPGVEAFFAHVLDVYCLPDHPPFGRAIFWEGKLVRLEYRRHHTLHERFWQLKLFEESRGIFITPECRKISSFNANIPEHCGSPADFRIRANLPCKINGKAGSGLCVGEIMVFPIHGELFFCAYFYLGTCSGGEYDRGRVDGKG
jgi:hypothetical protein